MDATLQDSGASVLPKGTYVVEVLRGPHDVRRLLIFVVLHPALSEEFPVR